MRTTERRGAALRATERIAWLDVAKGLSIVLVAMFHAHLTAYELGFRPLYTGPFNVALQPIRMPLFFAISGILAASSLGRTWPELLSRKVWVFVYIFALWGLIRWVFFGQVLENVRAPEEGNDWTQLLVMWVMPSSSLWYIWALAIFYVIAKAADRYKAAALVGAFVLACLTWGGVIPPTLTTYRVSVYLFFFLAGAYYGPQLLAWIPARPWMIGLPALAAFLVLEYVALPVLDTSLADGVLRALESVLGLAVGGAAAVLLIRVPPVRDVFARIGQHTLSVYVTHGLIVAILAQLLSGFAGAEPWRYLIVPVLVIVSVSGSLLLEAASKRLGLAWLYDAPRLPVAQRPVTP
ncbi:acyltransferase family protein [Devosia sp. CN2-171]|uniref:acyltransferase family protein n=1 Tax=Devosia sp. CN2-171 TaxID=3400909 RepID=UPI003BF77C2C